LLGNAITTLGTHAERHGLSSEQLVRLIDVLVLPQGLDRGSISRIVSGMFPRDKVEEEIGVKIIACLGLGAERAPLPIQVCPLIAGVDEGVVVEVAGHDLSAFIVAKGPSTVVRRDIQLPPLRHPSVLPPKAQV
jgi:hypothetical protein